MSHRLSPVVTLAAAVALCGATASLLTGCGGGAVEEPVAATAHVRLDACVVDQHYVPHEGVPVRVVSADGRLLAHAQSGRMGEFSLQLPARTAVALVVDRDGGEWMQVPAQARDGVTESCLVARDMG